MKFQDVINAVNKWLILKDNRVIKILLGTVIANRFESDPVWLFIIAPPSSAKTELIRALSKIPQIYPLSSLTPQTFISGKIGTGKKNLSLLTQLNNKILTFKDFTTVMSLHRDKQAEILSQLREIYDGQYKKSFGTGDTVEWKGKLGFIAGVTPIVDTHYSIYNTLGERFIQYRLEPSDPIALAKIAMKGTGKETNMRNELCDIIAQFINGIQIPAIENIIIPNEIENKLAWLSAYCVIARSGIVRDGYSREMIYRPEPEATPRLAKALSTLARGLAVINGAAEVSLEDYALIYKVGMDILHPIRRGILKYLTEDIYSEFSTSRVAEKIGYPINTTRRYLEDLSSLNLVRQIKGGSGNTDNWILSSSTIKMVDEIEPYPKCRIERV